jgi:2-polyprenyl-6-hydroxyphenyl methylase/3-demethylubiquinone-9 3-methyltransferase
MSSSVQHSEIENFSKDAAHWWNESGPFAPLHRLNPTRLGYIKDQICRHYGLNAHQSLRPFEKLSVLDVGCGGGLVCEPMARMGAKVTGIDADAVAINVANDHAAQSGLSIAYENKAAEELQAQFDVILALEIIEHVADPAAFAQSCAKLVKPGGLVIFSTLNRTPKSFALGIVAAEYILRWVPRGTHSWKKFIKPSELSKHARNAGLKPQDISGLIFNPLKGDFEISKTDIDVNYLLTSAKS